MVDEYGDEAGEDGEEPGLTVEGHACGCGVCGVCGGWRVSDPVGVETVRAGLEKRYRKRAQDNGRDGSDDDGVDDDV